MNNRTKIHGKLWVNVVLFGLIGQIAWVVENMYFATFCQDIFGNANRPDLSYIITTLMVVFSAITATITTILAGAKCDKAGKRKPFISIGYIIWGFTIMIFAFIPMKPTGSLALVGLMLVLFDCIMTVAGSTSNDAAFNAWITDNTDMTNRGRVDAILSILPLIAVVIVFIGLGPLYSSNNESNALFFIILGLIPTVTGIVAIFLIEDSPNILIKSDNYIYDTFYGFRKNVVRKNKMMYVCLSAYCIVCISQQTFFSYLINFIIKTLGFGDSFAIPMAVIILGAATVTAVFGVFFDKIGRKNFYYPLLMLLVLGTLSFYFLKDMSGVVLTYTLYIGGIMMMGCMLSLTGALLAAFQDYTPKGFEGRFQGIRMCFTVLIPMIIGPIVSMIIGLDAMGMNGDNFAPTYNIFLAAALIAMLAGIPLFFVQKDDARLRYSLKD